MVPPPIWEALCLSGQDVFVSLRLGEPDFFSLAHPVASMQVEWHRNIIDNRIQLIATTFVNLPPYLPPYKFYGEFKFVSAPHLSAEMYRASQEFPTHSLVSSTRRLSSSVLSKSSLVVLLIIALEYHLRPSL